MQKPLFPAFFLNQLEVNSLGVLHCLRRDKEIRWTVCQVCKYCGGMNWKSGLDDYPHSIECAALIVGAQVRYPIDLECLV